VPERRCYQSQRGCYLCLSSPYARVFGFLMLMLLLPSRLIMLH
jgi:hypothetical protein